MSKARAGQKTRNTVQTDLSMVEIESVYGNLFIILCTLASPQSTLSGYISLCCDTYGIFNFPGAFTSLSFASSATPIIIPKDCRSKLPSEGSRTIRSQTNRIRAAFKTQCTSSFRSDVSAILYQQTLDTAPSLHHLHL